MKLKILSVVLGFIIICNVRCSLSTQYSELEGYYIIDKESLIDQILEESPKGSKEDDLVRNMFGQIAEGFDSEFVIRNDSIIGFAWDEDGIKTIRSKILKQNDSFYYFDDEKKESMQFLENGATKIDEEGFDISYLRMDSMKDINIAYLLAKNKLNGHRKELDGYSKILEVVEPTVRNIKSKEKEGLNKWLIGNYVDRFGDETGEHFIYATVKGKKESYGSQRDIFVRIMYQDEGGIKISILDNYGSKETFPEWEIGRLEIKYSDKEIATQVILFQEDSFIESKKPYRIKQHIEDGGGQLSILLDMRYASESPSKERYLFKISSEGFSDVKLQ